MEASNRTIQFNVMVQEGKVLEEDAKIHTTARMLGNMDTVAEIEEKYIKPEPEPSSNPDLLAEHTREKATKAYKAFAKTARYSLLKEEVLLESNYTCRCCDKQFPVRSSYDSSDGSPYPLFVRSIIPPVQYLLSHKIFDAKVACTDAKLLDPQNYVALCSACKPVGFKR